MAGSITWREYVTDYGAAFSIRVDKSNASLRGGITGEELCRARGANFSILPKTLSPRRLHCFLQGSPLIRRNFICGNRQFFSAVGDRFTAGNEYLLLPFAISAGETARIWIITGYTGESFSCPTYYGQRDTGVDDGTTSQ